MNDNFKILCFSPTGSSLIFAEKISSRFGADILDITKENDRIKTETLLLEKKELEEINLLFIVCPVYAHGIPKIVKNFLEKLPSFNIVVPCVVFGGISAGHALFDLTKLIKKRNGKILGALEISAPHIYLSLLNKVVNELDDINNIEEKINDYFAVLERRIYNKEFFDKKIKKRVNPFAYIVPNVRAKISIRSLKVNKMLCFNCQECIKNCPVSAINNNLKIKNRKCIRCLACVKICPNAARKFKTIKIMKWYLNKYQANAKTIVKY